MGAICRTLTPDAPKPEYPTGDFSMKDWSQIKRAVTPVELEAAIADLNLPDPDLNEAMASLIREGLIVDSGDRRNGRIVWKKADRLPHRCATDDRLPEVFEIRSDYVYHDRECPVCHEPAVVPEGYKENDDYYDTHWEAYNVLWDSADRFECVGCGALYDVRTRKPIATFH
jgi:hypothetical protein